MPVDKLSIEQFSQKIKAKYPQYKDINDTTLAQKIVSKYPEYKGKVNYDFDAPQTTAPKSEATQSSILPVPTGQTDYANFPTMEEAAQRAQGKHNKAVDDANKTIGSIIHDDKVLKPLAGKMMVEQRQADLQNQAGESLNKGATDNPVHIQTGFGLPVQDHEVDQFAQAIKDNPELQIKTLVKAKNENPKIAKSVDKALYVLQSQDRANNTAKQNQIAENADKIESGELVYKPQTGQLIKPEGLGESLHTASQRRNDDMELFDLADNGKKEDLIHKLNQLTGEQDPDNPTPVPTGIGGHIGEFAGGQGKITAEVAGAQALNLIPGLGTTAAEALSAGLYAHEFARRGFSNELQRSYSAFKKQGLSDDEALDKATRQAKIAMTTDAATAAIMGKATSGAGSKLLTRTPVKEAVKLGSEGGWYNGVIKNGFDFLKKEAPVGIKNASLAGGGEITKNIAANVNGENRDVTEGAAGAAGSMLALHYTLSAGFALLGNGVKSATPLGKKVMQGFTKVPLEDAQIIANEQVKAGNITPQDAAGALKSIEEHKEIDQQIPASIKNDEVRLKLHDWTEKLTDAQEEKKTVAAPYKEAADKKIEHIEEKMKEISSSPEAKEESPKQEPVHTESYAGVKNVKIKEPVGEAEIEVEQPTAEATNGNTVGIAHESQESRASKLGQDKPERGEGVTVQETVDHGRKILKDGGDPQSALEGFQKDKKISYDDISLVRAHLEKLAKETNAAVEKHGLGSPEAEEAKNKEQDWRKQIKPMQTEWAKIGTAQQGETDIDTGTVMGLQRAFTDAKGRDFTPAEKAQAEAHVKTIAEKDKKIADLQKQLDEAHKTGAPEEPKSIKQKAKSIADKIRKGKLSKPGSFSAATPASLVWDTAIEASAKVIEASGAIAEAVAEGVKHIKASDWYKGLSKDKQKNAINDFTEHVESSGKEKNPLKDRLVDKTDNKFSQEDAKNIWEYAKENHIDKGSSYVDTVKNVASELGLTPDQVRHAFATPKGSRVISDEIYRQNLKRNEAIREAKYFVKKSDAPAVVKFFKSLPRFFFAAKVFGHGTVGMITHAGTNIFRPSQWKSYWTNFARQFKFSFGSLSKKGEANYAKAMEDLKNDTDFIPWKRAGLAVDPKETYDEYQGMKKIFGKIGAIGDRGFNALKTYRLDLAKSLYDGLSDVEKADPEMMKEIAKIVNHSTGTSEIKVGNAAPVLLFAPKLELSRWQGLITDPAHAIGTFINWKKATTAEKVKAKIVAKKAGEIISIYAAGLAANSAILSLTGSKQSINYTNPLKSDWLKFKAGDKTIDASGGVLSSMRLVGTLLETAYTAYTGNKKQLRENPQDKDYKILGQQFRYKMSPFLSTLWDLGTGTDAMGRPLPYSNVHPRKGQEPYTIGSYLTQQQLPIPITEGIKATMESMKERGMSKVQAIDILTGIGIGAISGGTGAKVQEDFGLHNTPKKKDKGRK